MAYPTLNQNELNSSLYNQIISQQIFSRITEGGALVDKARVDGTLFGDTKTYFAADVIHTTPYVQDSPDALNLLSVSRNKSVRTQAIVLDQFRIAETTIDDLMTKRAWSDEGSFAAYNDLLNAMVSKALYIHDSTNYDAYIGAKCYSSVGKQAPTALTLTSGKEGQEIAKAIADIFSDMTKKPSRNYNDYGHMTQFSDSEIMIVWNDAWVNKIEKIDLPVIFHKDGLMEKFAENTVHPDYFGDIKKFTDISAGTVVVGKPIKKTGSVYTFEPDASETMVLRALEEMELTCTDGTTKVSFFAGEQIVNPNGKVLVVTDCDEKFYVANPKIICKIFVKLPPYMSAAELGSEFYNPKNHSTNRYLVFGRNTIEKFDAYPVVTVKAN